MISTEGRGATETKADRETETGIGRETEREILTDIQAETETGSAIRTEARLERQTEEVLLCACVCNSGNRLIATYTLAHDVTEASQQPYESSVFLSV